MSDVSTITGGVNAGPVFVPSILAPSAIDAAPTATGTSPPSPTSNTDACIRRTSPSCIASKPRADRASFSVITPFPNKAVTLVVSLVLSSKLARIAAKHGIFVAYHGHEQQTPTFWDTALKQSTFNSLNLDLGHYVAAGNADPLGIIRDKFYRIQSMHLKDRQKPENGKGNVVWGSGDTPIREALQLMRENKYDFPSTIELEYDIPEGSDAVAEVKKCLEFCREALS